ncbi:MAG: inovirus-type Gp2 protein [Hafnia sp.]
MTYRTNPNYTIDDELFTDLTGHMERLRDRYSDVIPLRMDFAYKVASKRYADRYRDHWDMDMYRLAERILRTNVVIGYAWVMEFTYQHGLHFHAVFYLDGQRKRNCYRSARTIAEEWRSITDGEGIFENCQKKVYHKVNGARCLHYSDRKGYRDLAFILSYMAKQEQKEMHASPTCWLSDIRPRGPGGRPRNRKGR